MMAFKFLALVSLVAAVSAGLIPVEHHEQPQLYHAAVQQHQQPQHVIYQKPHDIHGHAHAHEVYPDDPHPKYNFAYDVQDAVSGDSKSQVEERDGDVVRGEYSLDDADGYRRTVKYTADSVNGFNAVVHREPLAHAHHTKLVAAAPASPLQYHHAAPQAVLKAPVAYSAPAYVAPTYNVHHEYEPQHHQHQQYHQHHQHQQHQQQQQQQQHHQQQQQQHHEQQQHQYATYEAPAPATHVAHDYYHH